MLDLSISVVVLELIPLQKWSVSRWSWKVTRNIKSGRMQVGGTEDSKAEAIAAASRQCAVFVETNPESAGVE